MQFPSTFFTGSRSKEAPAGTFSEPMVIALVRDPEDSSVFRFAAETALPKGVAGESAKPRLVKRPAAR